MRRAYMRGHETARQMRPAYMRGRFSAVQRSLHLCGVNFQPCNAPRIYARSVFSPEVHPASMHGEIAQMKQEIDVKQ